MHLLLPPFESYLQGCADTPKRFSAAYNFVQRRERTLHPVFDIDMFVKVLGWRVYEAMQFHTSQNLVD